MNDHLLIVDDDRELRQLLADYLGRNGFQVTGAADGRGLWAALEQGQVDLVILDVMLPGDNGYDILRALRRDPANRTLPVILLTARGGSAARDLAREAGASLFMAKPFANAELLAAVRQLVGV